MVDDYVGDRLDSVAEQRRQHRAVFSEITITVTQVEVFLGMVPHTVFAGERGGRQPYQIEPSSRSAEACSAKVLHQVFEPN